MSTTLESRPPVTTAPAVAGVPFTRLTRVEFRKMVDTRSGRWLLAIVAVAGLGMIAGSLAWSDAPLGFAGLLGATVLPLSLLLPIIGIMAATAEWSQRTGLVTFTLEPRRGRVVAAKVTAAVLLGLLVLAVVTAASALAVLATGAAWDFGALAFGGLALGLILYVLQGVAFGFALLNTPAAIVASLVLPVALTIVSGLSAGFRSVAEWVDLPAALTPLTSGGMTGTAWAHLATSAALWIALPMAVGTWRVLTREVK